MTATALIAVGLAGSWVTVHLPDGVQHVVPHFYYVPSMFAAVRFGAPAGLLVGLLAGVLAGPLSLLDVASATSRRPDGG